MKFTYENQGAFTYLVCELEQGEQVDSLTLGMLTNNHITGFAPVLYTEMNGQRFLKYNISAKVTADQFFAGSMNKQRALTAFQNILQAICSAEEYMIDLGSFVIDSAHIYLNVSSCETAMICVPVMCDKDIHREVAALFKRLVFLIQFDGNEDASYITQLITYINSGSSFTIYGLRDLVAKLQSGAAVVSPAAPAPAAHQQAPVYQPTAPATPFESTISIDDMPAMMGQTHQPQLPQPAVSVKPMPKPQPQPQMPPRAPVQPAVNVSRPNQEYGVRPQQAQPPQPSVPQRPATPRGPGFAIPGQPAGMASNVSAPTPPQPPIPAAAPADEKKITFLGLLSHYSKENAELYKRQKEEAKAKKAASNVQPAQRPVMPQQPGIHNQPPVARPPVSGAAPAAVQPSYAAQQPYVQPQQQSVRPMPVQNSFNETTVLSPSMVSGETTVLGGNMNQPDPALTRVKTGERIRINKPVFRIGKEKSYVDYFIGDNTAISRSHANIHTDNGEYFVEDTNSTNHTYVNGKLISSNVKVKITSGDKIRLANEDFIFSV